MRRQLIYLKVFVSQCPLGTQRLDLSASSVHIDSSLLSRTQSGSLIHLKVLVEMNQL